MRLAASLLFLCCAVAQAPAGAIHGVVRDASTGAPLGGFTVRVTHKVSATTDEHGRYLISDIPPGTFQIRASGRRAQTAVREVEINAYDDLQLDFEIPPDPRISGRVIDPAGRPIADTLVWLIGSEFRDGLARYVTVGSRATAKDGSYTFDPVPAGRKLYLLAHRPIPARPNPDQAIEVPTYYGGATSLDSAAAIELRPGERRENTDIKIRTSAHYCIDGEIDVSGKPAAMPFQILEPALSGTSAERAHAKSSADGKFRVRGIAPGHYNLSVVSADYAGFSEFRVGGGDAHNLHVSLETVPLHLEVVWDGTPPQKGAAAINLIRTSDRARVTKVVWGRYDGDFSPRIPANDYLVDVSLPPGCCYLKEMAYSGMPFEDRRLRLPPGSSGTLRLVLAAGTATLDCHATDLDGKTVDGYFVLLPESAAGGSAEAASSQISLRRDAELEPLPWELPPGKYRLLAVNRALNLPDDLDKIWRALGQATAVVLAPGGRVNISVIVAGID